MSDAKVAEGRAQDGMTKPVQTSHSKTRNGCHQCKRRKVKVRPAQGGERAWMLNSLRQCDCIGPVCANCRRRRELCSYSGQNEMELQLHSRPASVAVTEWRTLLKFERDRMVRLWQHGYHLPSRALFPLSILSE